MQSRTDMESAKMNIVHCLYNINPMKQTSAQVYLIAI